MKTLKYLTVMHYNNYEFEISFDLDGTWYENIYIAIDQTEDQLHGLPGILEDFEDIILKHIDEDFGDVIEELRTMDKIEYDTYVAEIKNYFN